MAFPAINPMTGQPDYPGAALPGINPITGTRDYPSAPSPSPLVVPPGAKPPAKGGKRIPKPAPGGALTYAQLLELARTQANQDVSGMQAPITSAQAAFDARTEQQRQAYVALSQAAAEMLKGIGPQYQQGYQSAAKDLSDIGAPLSEGLRTDLANSEATNRAFVDRVAQGSDPSKAPSPQAVKDATYALGVLFPGQALESKGLAGLTWGMQQPSIALGQGREWLRQLDTNQAQKDSEYEQQLIDVANKFPSLRDSALSTLQKFENDKATQALSQKKYNLSVKAQSTKDKTAAFNAWAKQQSLNQGQDRINQGQERITLAQAKTSFDEWATSQGLQIRWKNLSNAEKRIALSQANASALQSKTINGHVFMFDKHAGTYYMPGNPNPVNPNSFAPVVKVTAAALGKANKFLDQSASGFYASQVDPNKPLSSGAIASAAKAAHMSVSEFLAGVGKDGSAASKAGIGKTKVDQHEDPHIQDLYLSLVRDYGIPARKAYSMIAKRYPQWGSSHQSYFPKAGAAQGAADPAVPARAVAIVHDAAQQRGIPYKWGGESPQSGFDCSGLAQWAYGQEGVSIPRTSQEQFRAGAPIKSVTEARAGDLFFYAGSDGTLSDPGHVAIYNGDGTITVAPHSGAYVQVVRWDSISGFAGIRRFVN